MDWETLQLPTKLQSDPEWDRLRIPSESGALDFLRKADISHLAPFTYEPLDPKRSEIRVLYLHGPVNIHSQYGRQLLPSGSVKHVSLNENPIYTALSYVWGLPTEQLPIILDGDIFHVTRNLYDALQQLQDFERTLPIWIDAICINQADKTEKSSQVQQMERVYRDAKLVIGWLGVANEDSDLAIMMLDHIGEASEDLPDAEDLRWDARRVFFNNIISPDPATGFLTFPTTAIVAFFNRPWWRRIWIVQEVVLAQEVYVMVGTTSTTFRSVLLAFTLLCSMPQVNALCENQLASHLETIAPILRCDPRLLQAAIRGQAQERAPLMQRLHEIQGLGATDKRDVVYGLLGMVSDAEALGIKVDYGKSAAQVFTSITKALLQKEGQLKILAKCKAPTSIPGLPSWVPDWSDTSKIPIWYQDLPLYTAGGPNTSSSSFKVTDTQLTISGSEFDTVSTLGPPHSNDEPKDDRSTIAKLLTSIATFARTNCHAYSSAAALQDAIVRTPIADRETAPTGPSRERIERRAGQGCLTAFTALTNEPVTPPSPPQEAIFSYRAHTLALLSGRRIFATSRGHLGLGPASIQPGDTVCVFSGVDVPFVVRKTQTQGSGSFWRNLRTRIEGVLVGECYVHGIMDGEGQGQGRGGVFGGVKFVIS